MKNSLTASTKSDSTRFKEDVKNSAENLSGPSALFLGSDFKA